MKSLLLFFTTLFICLSPILGSSQIQSSTVLAPVPTNATNFTSPVYDKIELGIVTDFNTKNDINNNIVNPYDENDIRIYAEIKDSYGQLVKTIDAFYMLEYATDIDGQATTIETVQDYNWRLRFRVEEQRDYTLRLYFKQGGNTVLHSKVYTITGTANPNSHGVLRIPAGNKYFEYTDGTPFFGISENFPPYNNPSTKKYDPTGENQVYPFYPTNTVRAMTEMLTQFASNGGNFTKFYFMPDALDLEWEDLGNYSSRQNQAQDLDQLFYVFENNNIKVQLGPWTWEQLSNTPEIFKWDNNPYKTIQGVQSPLDLYANGCDPNPTNLAFLKRKIRYMYSRWGYSTSFSTIELMTELDRIKDYWSESGSCPSSKRIELGLIHLAEYCQSLSDDIMVTCGNSLYTAGQELFENDAIDYTSFHGYSNFENVGNLYSFYAQYHSQNYNKPYHQGEMGLLAGGSIGCWQNESTTQSEDPLTHIRNSIWSTSFSGSFGNACPFWTYGATYSLLYNKQLSGYYKPLSAFFQDEDLNEYNYKPIRNADYICADPNNIDCSTLKPECIETPIFSCHVPLHTNTNPDYDPKYDLSINPEVSSSDDAHIEIYALKSDRKILGWVHNLSNYWFNRPHFVGDCNRYEYYIHSDANGNYPPPQTFQDQTIVYYFQTDFYVTDLAPSTMTFTDLNCDGTYNIDWYRTDGNGGIESSLSQTNLQPTTTGELTINVPSLKRRISNSTDLPDYAFKLTLEEGATPATTIWKTKEVNEMAPASDGRGIISFSESDEIFYRGADGNLYNLYYDDHCWDFQKMSAWGYFNQIAVGSPITPKGTSHVFYRNNSGYLQHMFKGTFQGNQQWIPRTHSSFPKMKSNSPISIDAQERLFYINTNNRIVVVEYNSTNGTWEHEVMGLVSAASTYSPLTVSADNKIFFRNHQGKLTHAYLYYDLSNLGTTYWTEYQHNSALMNAYSDIVITPNGEVFYQNSTNKPTLVWKSGSTWTTQNVSWADEIAAGSFLGNPTFAVMQSGTVFYKNVNNKITQVQKFGNTWHPYTHTATNLPNSTGYQEIVASENSNAIYYFDAYDNLNKMYYSGGWQYESLPDALGQHYKLSIDRHDKLFHLDQNAPRNMVTWLSNTCADLAPCTVNPHTKVTAETPTLATADFDVYPNPFHDFITIRLEEKQAETAGRFVLHNSIGQTIKTGQLAANNALETESLPSGIYILSLFDKKGSLISSKKLIKAER